MGALLSGSFRGNDQAYPARGAERERAAQPGGGGGGGGGGAGARFSSGCTTGEPPPARLAMALTDWNASSSSIGNGKITVELFSAEISDMVWSWRSWRAPGASAITRAACASRSEA